MTFRAFSQLYGEYILVDSTQCFPENIEYYLGFGKGHVFELAVDYGNTECFGRKVISRGTFDLDIDTLILKNKITGMEMRFQMKEDGHLTSISTITGLTGKTLKPFVQFFADEESPEYKFGRRSLLPVQMGSFYASSSEEFLILSANHQYTYTCCDKVITQGTWRRRWNKLYLIDKDLDEPFIGILKKDRLEIFEDEMGKVK